MIVADNLVRSGKGMMLRACNNVEVINQLGVIAHPRDKGQGRGLELGSVEIGHSIRREVPHDI